MADLVSGALEVREPLPDQVLDQRLRQRRLGREVKAPFGAAIPPQRLRVRRHERVGQG